MGGGGGNSGPTLQQQQLQTQQALTTANLNLEENAQRKTILNAMQGTRVFRGSALSRALAGNSSGSAAAPGPSSAQVAANQVVTPPAASLLDTRDNTTGNPSASSTAATRFTGGTSGVRGGGSGKGEIP